MGNALQDQLLKAGLIDRKKANKSKKQKYQQVQQGKGKNNANRVIDPEKQEIARLQAEKVQRDRELNQKKEQLAQEKALIAQIRQLIDLNRQAETRENGLSYNFSDQNKIKKVQVSTIMHQQLSDGLLAIARLDEKYSVIPRAVAEKIRLRNAHCIVVCNDRDNSNEEDDDPYADYKIPDDLMW